MSFSSLHRSVLAVFAASALLGACAAPAGADDGAESSAAIEQGDGSSPELALAKKAGCTACHAVDKKIIGPTFREVADRYAGRTDVAERLTAEVRRGSSYGWGRIPMPATTTREASDEEIDSLVGWILTLRTVRPATPTTSTPSEKTGLDLAKDNGCFACHAIDKTIVGPAFKVVAQKYAGNPGATDVLVGKITRGGGGVWGRVPMPPSADGATDAEVATMVSWILSL